jgi:hypothetical protein
MNTVLRSILNPMKGKNDWQRAGMEVGRERSL